MIRSMACTKLGTKCEAFQREGQKWVCTTGLPSDVVIDVGEMSFHLHKFPLLERSGLLGKMIAEFPSEEGTGCVLQLTNIPGGAKAFELVAKFCYGIKQELNAQNVVSLRCAAEHLQMTEDYGEGNLIAQTENFLNKIFSGWKDTIKALKSCEDLLPYAEELHIISRCINSLALKACTEPNLWMVSGGNSRQSPDESTLWNGIDSGDTRKPSGHDWWYEDVTCLRLPLYKRVIIAMEAKGMKPESLAGALVFYAKTYLPTLNRQASFQEGTNHLGSTFSAASESDQRVLLEEIVNLLPSKKNVTSTKCLLSLLCNAMILQASPSCRENLEKRVGAQLDQASLEDLIVPNMGYSVETLYDVDCIRRILDHFLLSEQSQVGSPTNVEEGQLMGTPSLTPMTMVAKLIDGYLAEVASDVNLKFPKFQSIAAAIPDYARPVDDGIYRAIDIYLKAHPWLSDSEREQLCRLMNCQKLSLEACTHAAQNERLPLRVVVQVLFFEQLRLRTSIAGWFFVSDNHENTQTSHGNLALPKNDGPTQLESEDEIKAKETKGKIDMKEKVLELEKECMNIKQEIEKLGKKSNSSILSRIFWFKSRSPSHECTKSS